MNYQLVCNCWMIDSLFRMIFSFVTSLSLRVQGKVLPGLNIYQTFTRRKRWKKPTDFDFDMLISPSAQKFIKHVSTVSTSVTAPFVAVSLNRTAASLWFTCRSRRRSVKTSWCQRQLMTGPDPGHQVKPWDRALDICPMYRKWPDGFVTAGADRESRLNWFNLRPLKGRQRWTWSVLKTETQWRHMGAER